jgi:hypothetical protein
MGRIPYLDDLAALAARHGIGLGTTILKYVHAAACRLGCEAVHFDTGCLTRGDLCARGGDP